MSFSFLSALPAHDLAGAIARKELGKLTSISGIGKKTAERLLLELKDKLPILEGSAARSDGATPIAAAPPRASSNTELLARALVNMGYKTAEAERAIEQLDPAKIGELPLPDLLKETLAFLSK